MRAITIGDDVALAGCEDVAPSVAELVDDLALEDVDDVQLKPSVKNDKAARAILREHEEAWLGDLAHVTKPRIYRRGFLAEIGLQKPGVAGPERWAAAAAAPALATVERIHATSGNAANYLQFVLSPQARSLRTIDVLTKGMLETLLAHDRALPVRELSLGVVIDPKTATTLGRSPLFPALERVTFAVRYGGLKKLMAVAESFLAVRPLAIRARPLDTWGTDLGEFAAFGAAALGPLAAAHSLALMVDELFELVVRKGTKPDMVRVELICRHLRFASELLPELRHSCAIEEVSIRLPTWFDAVLVPQDPLLVHALDGLKIVPDEAWAAFLGNRTSNRA